MAEQLNKQLLILEQENGKKIYLDLNVSTDTTAIESFKQAAITSEKAFDKGVDISTSSFDYATGIAVFLALCATGLAYWFGAKSFVLTKQSFEAVVKQIKSSENLMETSNRELIESQENLKRLDIANERCNSIRLVAAEFISLCEHLMYEAKNLQNNLIGDLPLDYIEPLTQKRDLMEINGTKLELYLGRSHLSASVLLLKRGLIRDITSGLRRESHNVDINYWKNQIRDFKLNLTDYFEKELFHNRKGD
ncbi:hypothetical protein G9F31_01245 [Acinetobacter sp. 187]|uniref:hypothetical protein n=1 Tax=Acinetobacter lanii TaxID=2715163 RepID=UPI00140D8E96|nr:hypothetical protein [Acinetobacter lanii]NHC02409.1 hypothetical protein [Acinetobacter lanii]